MTSDLCLAFLTTWLVAVSAAPGPSNLQTRSTNGACNVNGVVYQDGQRFKLSQQSCITYLCKAGGYSIVEQGCLSGGACHDVGTNFTDDCHLYTCQSTLSGGYVTLKKSLVQARCKDANNMCHDPGDLFPFDYNGQIHQGCTCTATGNQVAYSCDTGSSSSSSSSNNSSRDCQVDGFKFSNGQRVSIPGKSKCVKYLCTDGHASIVQKGCEVDNFCHSVGSSIQDKCDVYKCVEEQVGNAISLHTNLIFRGCIDANTRCRAPGEKFPYVINGVLEQDCTCSDVGGQIRYSCTSVVASHNCTVNGHEFADGQEFVYPGQSKCVKYKCDKGSYKPVQEGCEANGACHAIGSVFETNCVLKACKKITYPDRSVLSTEVLMRRCKDSNSQCHDPGKIFSYEMNGHVRGDCTCRVNGTQISYRCGPDVGSGGTAGSGQSGTNTTAVAGRNCSISGNTYTDGQVFTLPGVTKCVKYKCSNGGYRVIEEGCENGGVCHPVNATFTIACHRYTCHKTLLSPGQVSLGIQLSQIRCTASNGSCYDQGAIFSYEIGGQLRDDCTCQKTGDKIGYKCGVSSPSNPTVSPAVSHRDCTVSGLTYTHGQRFYIPGKSQCVMYQCMDGQNSIIQEGCELNNRCYDVGSNFQIGCHKYTCDKSTVNGNNIYQGHVTQLRCSGANGKCYDVGETFPKSENGQDFNNCSCSVDGGKVKYACQPNNLGSRSCHVHGKEYKNGETFTIDGQSKCFVYTCTDGGYKMTGDGCEVNGVCHDVDSIFPRGCHLYTCNKVHNGVSYTYKTTAQKLRCKDADDICQDPGSTFPLVIGGHRYEQCTCNLDNGSLRYSCSG